MTDMATRAIDWSKKRKKISYDIDIDTLGMIDELAEITHGTRAQILDSILFPGTRAQVENMLTMWKDLIKNKVYSEETQKRVKELIKNIEIYKKKWEFDQFPLLMKTALDKYKSKK